MNGGSGIIPINEHECMTMGMDSSSSASSSSMQPLQAMVFNDQFDTFSMLNSNRYDMTCAAGFPDMPACLTQVGVVDGLYGDYGILEPNKMGITGLERDLALPPLESRSIEDNGALIDVKCHNNHFNNSCFNNTDQQIHQMSSKVEDLFGFGNHGQGENLRMGEWDLEGLMQDISSFPFLDFQVE